jgi:hypothetical protein
VNRLLRSLFLAAILLVPLARAFAAVPPPVPALPDTERRTSFTITASTCACNVGFQLYGDGTDYQNWVEVWLNGTQVPFNDPVQGWTITSPSGPIGNLARPITDAVLTFSNPQTGTVQIVGARRPRRTSQFSENQGVSARNLNQVITDIVAMLRETWDKINDVTGRVVLAPPGETFTPLPPASQRSGLLLCFDSNGDAAVCSVTSSGSIAAGNGISVTGTNPSTISANIQGSGPIIVTGTNPLTISCPTCTASSGGATLVSSRAIAQTLNLSAFNVVQTGGYSTAGDGGGAIFQNVGTSTFLDSFVKTGTISSAGSGYTNGTYKFVLFTGGTGQSFFANVVVSGGAVTSVTPVFTGGGFGFSVGDVLTTSNANIGGTGSGFTWTVQTVSMPTASFTDAVGTHFQYVPSPYIDVRAFGAKFDWNGTDTGATDNSTPIQNAFNFGALPQAIFTNASSQAQADILIPAGIGMVCSPLVMFGSDVVFGMGPINSTLHMCDAFTSATANFIELGDPNAQVACFGLRIGNLKLEATANAQANSGTYMLHSNCAQQSRAIDNIAIYGGKRGCFRYDTGFGGAAAFYSYDLFCTMFSAADGLNDGIVLNGGTTLFKFFNTIVESSSFNGNGINAIGGQITFDGLHSEGVANPVNVNMASPTASFTLMHSTGGDNCNQFVTLQASNTKGNFALFDGVRNGCPNLVADGQGGGTGRETDALPSAGWVVFNP